MADGSEENVHFAYFGFGSLVNRKTLSDDTRHVIPATLKGWRRHWQPRPAETMISPSKSSIALLSIHQDASCDIDGLIVIDKIGNLVALDKREQEYIKVNLEHADFMFDNKYLRVFDDVSIHVYVSPPVEQKKEQISLIRSYLDVVMQGYLREYGENGLTNFMNSTKGFDLPILEDRKNPAYPRHQQISNDETEIFERFLPKQYWRN